MPVSPVPPLPDGRRASISNPYVPGAHDGVDLAFRALPSDGVPGTHAVTSSGQWANPDGQVAVAYDDGEVVSVRPNSYRGSPNGLAVKIAHGGLAGLTSGYLHLADTPLVVVGQTVRAGDPVGTISHDRSGPGAFNHLHFFFKDQDDAYVDPTPYLRGLVYDEGGSLPTPELVEPVPDNEDDADDQATIGLLLLAIGAAWVLT